MNAPTQPSLVSFSALTSERLRRDIAHYERKAAELGRRKSPRETTLRKMYETLAGDRQRLLAALKDGHPEFWTDYPRGKS